ncbi:MAG: peptidylprolyl isomerase [Acidobacteriia bacterium]|nr:peptidylprolyl isomerase [Terriglobia bacterium]
MFDLFRSRQKTTRILLGAILVVVAASMLLYLVPNYGSAGSNASDLVVAEVGKEVITAPEVERLLRNQMKGRQLPPEVLPAFLPQMVNEMIAQRALAYEAERLGFRVSDADVANAIREMAPNLFPDGRFVGQDMYAAMLAQQNLTIPEFEGDLKRQMLIARLRDVALEGTIVTPLEIEQEYRKKNEKIKIEFVKLTQEKYRKESQPSAEDVQNYFKVNSSRYQVPEKKDLAILIADQAKLEQSVTASDADLQRAYSQNLNEFRMPERVRVRHILLKTTDKPAADDAKIKAKGEDLLKQIRAGADFAELAKKNSDDTGSAAKGGDLDWLARGQALPEIEKVAFSLKAGQTSDLIKTSIGYDILQVQQHEDARIKPFAEVKDELAAQSKKQRVNDLMQNISDKSQAELQKDPLHPEKVAAALKMELVRADGWQPGKVVPEVGASADFDQSVATLKKAEVSQAVALAPGNKIALAVVVNVTPSRPSTFEEVQNQVRDTIVQNRMAAAVQQHAKELIDGAKANGGDLAKVAKAMGLEVKTSGEVGRSGDVEGLGAANYVLEGFTKPDGTVFGPIAVTDGTAVVKVVQHVTPDMSNLAAQHDAIRDEIKTRKARDREALFEAGLVDALTRQGVVKPHQAVIDRLIGNFRG